MKGRVSDRFIRRLETEFTADDKSYRGISSNLSISGLFIRTQHAFVPGTIVDIVIHLPDTADVKLKGRVKHASKTHIVSVKNGMGIEIIQNNPEYISFIKSVVPDAVEKRGAAGRTPDIFYNKHVDKPKQPQSKAPEFTIIACPKCGVRNKVRTAKLSMGPKCGKCGHLITAEV